MKWDKEVMKMKKVFFGFGFVLLMTAIMITMAVTGEVVKDPVCKMEVDPAKATFKVEGKSGNVYFCSEFCKDKFMKNPTAYISQGEIEKMGLVLAGTSTSATAAATAPTAKSGCGGCAMEKTQTTNAAGCEAKTAEATECDGNCGKTKVKEINDFHTSMHGMESALEANNMGMVKASITDLVAKKELLMKAECPEGKCPNSFGEKRTAFAAKVDLLAAACQKDNTTDIKAAFQQMHDAYTALDHAAR
jgi:YHS domain-containing protein